MQIEIQVRSTRAALIIIYCSKTVIVPFHWIRKDVVIWPFKNTLKTMHVKCKHPHMQLLVFFVSWPQEEKNISYMGSQKAHILHVRIWNVPNTHLLLNTVTPPTQHSRRCICKKKISKDIWLWILHMETMENPNSSRKK